MPSSICSVIKVRNTEALANRYPVWQTPSTKWAGAN